MQTRPPPHRAEASEAPAGEEAEPSGPERRCIVTGEVRPKAELLRFVVGPDGTVVPDVAERLPGRGLWLTPRRDIVDLAAAKRIFARAARASVAAPENLSDRVELLLVQRCCDILGLARRAGQAVAGFEKVRERLRRGGAALLLAARDGAESGRAKLRAAAPELRVSAALDSAELAHVFGRDHAIHAVVTEGRLAERLAKELARLAGFRRSQEAGDLVETTPQRQRLGKDELNDTGLR
jgi:uncharacterized protein